MSGRPSAIRRWRLCSWASQFSTLAQAGEEVGWRGYALPRLAQYVGLEARVLLLGVVWAVWHLPYLSCRIAGARAILPAYLLQVMAMSVVFAFLYWKTDGSLLIAMLTHAAVKQHHGIVPAAIGGAITRLHWAARSSRGPRSRYRGSSRCRCSSACVERTFDACSHPHRPRHGSAREAASPNASSRGTHDRRKVASIPETRESS